MPQKACERGFFHVIAFSKFFEMPQNPIILFSVPFCFKIDHVLIFCNAPLFPFSESDRKNGAFQKLARDQFKIRKGIENEILRFWGISKN